MLTENTIRLLHKENSHDAKLKKLAQIFLGYLYYNTINNIPTRFGPQGTVLTFVKYPGLFQDTV